VSDIIAHGEWDALTLPGQGAVELSLVSRAVPARLEVMGTARSPKYLGAARTAVAFPAQSVGTDTPTTVCVATSSGAPFPGDHTVDLAIGVAGGQSYLLRSIPVSGRSSAAVITLSRSNTGIAILPGEGGSATLGLGGWCARRWEEQGRRLAPTLSTLVIDTSASMQQYAERVDALLGFLNDLYATVGVPAPSVRRPPVAGVEQHGVGQVVVAAAQGRVGVVTDLPPVPARADVLLVGSADVLAVVPDPGACALDAEAWAELMRDDVGFGARTLELLEPLLAWLTQPAETHGNGETA